MAITYDDKPVKRLFKELNESKLVLPNFQRGFVWDAEKQKNLIASLLVGLPMGALLTLEGEGDSFQKREICRTKELETNKEQHFYLLDGQQRISTLYSVFYDIFKGADYEVKLDNTYGTLRNRWFLRIVNDEEDIFGLADFNFKGVDSLIDQDVVDYIERSKILKKNKTKAFHPDFINKETEQGKAQYISKSSKEFSSDSLIPLYELMEENSNLHEESIRRVAEERLQELHDEIKDSGYKVDTVKSYLSDSDVDLLESINGLTVISDDNIRERVKDTIFRKSIKWQNDISSFLKSLLERNIPIISLDQDETERATAIFEAVNRGGATLSVFDLVVAKSAQGTSVNNLSEKIRHEMESEFEVPEFLNETYSKDSIKTNQKVLFSAAEMDVTKDAIPVNNIKDWFVNILSLISYTKIKANIKPKVEHIKKEKILGMGVTDIEQGNDRAIRGILRALAFLQIRCGISSIKNLSYRLMVVVLAYHLEDDAVWKDKRKVNILEYWYWVSLFSGAYDTRQNERCERDLNEVSEALENLSIKPFQRNRDKVFNAPGYSDKATLLRTNISDTKETEPSSVRESVLQFILSGVPQDFVEIKDDEGEDIKKELSAWKKAQGLVSIEIHHIIPLKENTPLSESSSLLRKDKFHYLNSVLNLTPISKEANSYIGHRTPDDYLKMIPRSASYGHFIPTTIGRVFERPAEFLENRFSRLYEAVEDRLRKLEP